MGRHIYETTTGEWVWRYAFAEQSSEQSRIVRELGVGQHFGDELGDTVLIQRDELPVLERWLKARLPSVGEWSSAKTRCRCYCASSTVPNSNHSTRSRHLAYPARGPVRGRVPEAVLRPRGPVAGWADWTLPVDGEARSGRRRTETQRRDYPAYDLRVLCTLFWQGQCLSRTRVYRGSRDAPRRSASCSLISSPIGRKRSTRS